MPNSLYPKYRQAALEGSIAYLTDNIKAVLVDLNTYGLAISSSTNATPPVITTAVHGYTSGDQVIIGQHLVNTAANNIATGTKFYITVLSTTTFSLYTDVARTAGVVGNGVGAATGFVVNITKDQFLSDIAAGARVATSGNLASKTSNQAGGFYGVADAADFTWTAVTGAQSEFVVVYKDTGTASTSPLICILDQATNLPVTPNGGDISVVLDNGANRLYSL
jgi:hypothetical protein